MQYRAQVCERELARAHVGAHIRSTFALLTQRAVCVCVFGQSTQSANGSSNRFTFTYRAYTKCSTVVAAAAAAEAIAQQQHRKSDQNFRAKKKTQIELGHSADTFVCDSTFDLNCICIILTVTTTVLHANWYEMKKNLMRHSACLVQTTFRAAKKKMTTTTTTTLLAMKTTNIIIAHHNRRFVCLTTSSQSSFYAYRFDHDQTIKTGTTTTTTPTKSYNLSMNWCSDQRHTHRSPVYRSIECGNARKIKVQVIDCIHHQIYHIQRHFPCKTQYQQFIALIICALHSSLFLLIEITPGTHFY